MALKYLKKYKPLNVYIHDAARPNFSVKLLQNISKNLKKNNAVVPVISSNDTIKYRIKNKIFNLNKKFNVNSNTTSI